MPDDGEVRALARRIEVIEAVEAIKKMKYRYWRACDAKDPDGFRRCFIARGASIDYGRLGRHDDVEPILRIYRDIALRKVNGQYVVHDMHHGFHPDIELVGPGEATGRWTLRMRQIDIERGTETVMAGEYDDRYVIEDGDWKHSQCHFRVLWSISRPIGPEVTILGSNGQCVSGL
ncbi:nuclear transport factor 2 family protein [Amycolatopsis taiwanensis]|uniref:SnoaL-like domain-containing protein n=1 Tax=Amycolatopsis taiwanensis TaxID=342230 RepID=A0A9W6QWR6_9PSEU|nr:nuclear transport factor 2 family protein [Amycolatopsis taiwanensis]GLY65464.1 hypothetical protein Atai01_20830 [Amycolatopsis taiwanensis]